MLLYYIREAHPNTLTDVSDWHSTCELMWLLKWYGNGNISTTAWLLHIWKSIACYWEVVLSPMLAYAHTRLNNTLMETDTFEGGPWQRKSFKACVRAWVLTIAVLSCLWGKPHYPHVCALCHLGPWPEPTQEIFSSNWTPGSRRRPRLQCLWGFAGKQCFTSSLLLPISLDSSIHC